jgi:hypothetical protein
MKSIKNITKGIIKIHYTAPHLALNLHCSVTIYEKIFLGHCIASDALVPFLWCPSVR